ncbi:MAG: hypothetical protein ACI9PP_000169 [Halobacteriales archaeon]|jgi:hypothetical protein
MNVTDVAGRLRRRGPAKRTLLYGAVIVNAEILWLLGYTLVTGVVPDEPLYYYPFVWLNVGLWAVWRTSPTPTTTRNRRIALGAATGYFIVLAYFGGLFGTAGVPSGTTPAGIRVALESLPPGWNPALLYEGEFLRAAIIPYKFVGYLALAYLVYATAIDAAGAALSGVIGLLSCVSCTWPVLATIVSGIAGSSTALVSSVYSQSYGLSTVVFVVTVGLLYWRPTQ